MPDPYYCDSECGITLYHGDCRKIFTSLIGLTIVAIIADPPYGVNVISQKGTIQKGDKRIGGNAPFRGGASKTHRHIDCKQYTPVVSDDGLMTTQSVFNTCLATWPSATHVWWGANYYCDVTGPSPCWIAWDKERQGTNFSQCELAWTNKSRPPLMIHHQWNGLLRASERGQRYHPTQKPVALYSWILQEFCKPGDLVLDPFAGSGPCLVACKRLGIKCIGIEIDAKYCITIKQRLLAEPAPMLQLPDEALPPTQYELKECDDDH